MITENPFLKRKILVVTAHPDDESYFAGSLRQVVKSGGEVRLVCGTYGERGRSYVAHACTMEELQQIRHAELRAAADVIGVRQVLMGGYPDGKLSDHIDSFTSRIRSMVEEYEPDCIVGYGPDGFTGHADHVASHIAGFSVAKSHGLPYGAFVLPPEPYRAELVRMLSAKRKHGIYVEAEDFMDSAYEVRVDPNFKLRVLHQHRSQLQGLNPYVVFGEVVGGYLMGQEHFSFLS